MHNNGDTQQRSFPIIFSFIAGDKLLLKGLDHVTAKKPVISTAHTFLRTLFGGRNEFKMNYSFLNSRAYVRNNIFITSWSSPFYVQTQGQVENADQLEQFVRKDLQIFVFLASWLLWRCLLIYIQINHLCLQLKMCMDLWKNKFVPGEMNQIVDKFSYRKELWYCV